MSPATASRRRIIRKLLGQGTITSQARLVELLEAEGYPVTQATVSRDLQVIGVQPGTPSQPTGLRGTHDRPRNRMLNC